MDIDRDMEAALRRVHAQAEAYAQAETSSSSSRRQSPDSSTGINKCAPIPSLVGASTMQPQTPTPPVHAGFAASASTSASGAGSTTVMATTSTPTSYPTRQRMGSATGKPKTPRTSAVGAAAGTTPGSNGLDLHKPAFKSSPSESRKKPTYTSSLNYPDILPAPTYFSAGALPSANGEEGELQRSQRRSKVEALGKIDRVGTPVHINSGPTATSFLPSSAQSQHVPSASAGPSSARNPIFRPVVVNPPFNPASVKQEAPRHPSPRTTPRMFGLEECPVYYPTAEEFQDTMAYISSISDEAKAYGICKIVPPEGWKMPFTLESEKFRFKTRLQRLNQLEAGSRAKINFLEQLSMFHNQSSETEVTIPKIDRQPLDLWKLRKEVNKAGGHFELDRTKTWLKIAEILGHKEAWANQIRDAYMKIVLPFDKWAMRAKSASLSPLTPLKPTNGTQPPAFAADGPTSPSQARSAGRMGSIKANTKTRMSSRVANSHQAAPAQVPLSSMAVNGLQPAAEIDRPASATDSLTTLKIRVPGFSLRDGSESELSEEDSSLSGSPPKRVKIATPEYQKGEVCEVCRGGHAADKILLCDGCDRGFHTYCLDPPLASVPTNEEWFCTSCLLSQGDDFGFEEGEDHSIASFQARDASFSYHWWNSHRPSSSSSSSSPTKMPAANGMKAQTPVKPQDPLSRNFGKVTVTEDDVEREFWRLTESATDTVDVEYGADVHSTTHGSAGPTMETHPLEPYAADGWNLNNMPILPDSLLRYIRSDISGMTVPWIYLGMMFSTFCWHNEDHYTYSVNYMYWGETKTWYGIPGSDAEKFEEAMKSEAPELFEQQPGLLFQLITMMNPGRVRDAGVKVVSCDQRPNEFVITFPKAYHCGFNHGINMNEAVNFALPDWLAEGKESVVRYKNYLKAPVFSHNELLITITLYSETIRTALWLKDSLTEMVAEEAQRRDRLRLAYPALTESQVEEDGPEDTYQCAVCKGFCYLAQVTCTCTKLVACLDHASQLCSCPKSKRVLRKRYTEAQLEEILAIIVARASLPLNWRNKLLSLLETPRPALKSMRALLTEGEKIAYPMAETQSLRALVDRANAWVDRVTALTTRKTTGRRRKGRKDEDEDEDMNVDRSPEVLSALLKEAERLAFDAPEIIQLKQSLLSIQAFQSEAKVILSTTEDELDLEKCKTVLILGESLNLDLPEVSAVATIVNRLTWFKKVEEEVDDRTLEYKDTVKLLQQAEEYEIPETHPTIAELRSRRDKGAAWLKAVEDLFNAHSIKIEEISALIEGQDLVPVSIDKMRQLESIRKTVLNWQTSAKNFLSSNGSALAAARLCKNVSTANTPINRIEIPEIVELQDELDHHAKWQEEMASILEVPVNKLTSTINYLKREFESHLAPEDDEPSDDFVCFCRLPAGAVMVTCGTCSGEYHPRCVGVTPKNANNPFQCYMCQRILPGDGPSMNEFAALVVGERWNFKITPPEFTTAVGIVESALRYSEVMLKMVDPKDLAEPYRDVEKIQHAIRKIYSLPLLYDAYNFTTNERFIFVSWLFRRMQDAIKFHAGLLSNGIAPKEKTRTRGRKPRFVLAQSYPREFKCICPEHRPPLDVTTTVECCKCGQGYHTACVKAPMDVSMVRGVSVLPEGEAKNWRCPCCTVKEAKYYLKGVEVRVQMKDQFGSNDYIDYRSTIQDYAETPVIVHLAPSTEVVLLECTKFIPPILPEDFNRDAHPVGAGGAGEGGGGDGDAPRKRRKVRASDAAPPSAPGPAPGSGHEVGLTVERNGTSTPVSTNAKSNGNGTAIAYSNSSANANTDVNGNGHGNLNGSNGYHSPFNGSRETHPPSSMGSPAYPTSHSAAQYNGYPRSYAQLQSQSQSQSPAHAHIQRINPHTYPVIPVHRPRVELEHPLPPLGGTASPIYVHGSSPVSTPAPATLAASPVPAHTQVQVQAPSLSTAPVPAPLAGVEEASSSISASVDGRGTPAPPLANRQPPPHTLPPLSLDEVSRLGPDAQQGPTLISSSGSAPRTQLEYKSDTTPQEMNHGEHEDPDTIVFSSIPRGDIEIDLETPVVKSLPSPSYASAAAAAAAAAVVAKETTSASSPDRQEVLSKPQTQDELAVYSTIGATAPSPPRSKGSRSVSSSSSSKRKSIDLEGAIDLTIPDLPSDSALVPTPAPFRVGEGEGATMMQRSSSRDSKGSAEDPIEID